MALFTWKPRYEIGIAPIDAEHRRMFELADKLHAALGQGVSGKYVLSHLAALIDCSRAHFAHEEQLMQDHCYPDLVRHKASHEELTEYMLRLQRGVSQGNGSLTAEELRFLQNAIGGHIEEFDRAIAEHAAHLRAIRAEQPESI